MRTIKPLSFALLACCMMAAPALAQDYVVSVKVFVNGQQVPVQHPSSLDVTGTCFLGGASKANGIDCDGNIVTDGVLHVEACTGDTLLFAIDPTEYDPDAVVNCWSVGGNSCTNPGPCVEDELNSYTHSPSGSQSITIFLTAPPAGVRDPVSARWNPDAGRRSGDDLAWGPAYLTAKSLLSDVSSDAFPALLYSGEAYEKQVDLAVKGRGLDFVFSRVHRSGAPDGNLDGDEEEIVDNFGFGGQWTHNFDIRAKVPDSTSEELPIDVTFGNGQIVRFHFKYHDSDTRFYYAEGWDAELRHEFLSTAPPSPGHFELVFGDGVRWVFPEFELSNNLGATQRIEFISDRFGNMISFDYDSSDRLEIITDTLGREYNIAYVSGEDIIESLTEEDGLGRVISYGYNGDDDLTSVTYPATSAFPNPDEPTITYTYDADGRLTTVTDPRGNDILTKGYTDGVLTSQQHGDGAEAGTVTFGYTGLVLMGGDDHAIRVTDAAGHATEHFFNARNQLVRLRRLDDGDGFTTLTTWAEHAFAGGTMVSDDLPASITLPDGIVVTYDYTGPGATNSDYKYRMNPVSITRIGTDGKAIIEEFGHADLGGSVDFWDARFGASFVTCHSLRDDGGALLSATAYAYSSDDLATLDGIDYYGIAPYAGDPFAACPPSGLGSLSLLSSMESSALESLLESEVMYSSLFQQLETSNSLYEFESILFGRELGTMLISVASEDHHESFGYNEQGQITEHLHPDNDEDGDPGDKVRRRDVFIYDDDADGYLDRKIVDADNEALTTTYTQDALGRVTNVVDPKNNETIIGSDELDQVLQVQQPLIDTTTDYRPTTEYAYDENGNVTRTRHHWTDVEGTPISTAGETDASSYLAVEYTYDTRNRLTSIARENGTGLSESQFEYDGNGNIVKQLSPLAVDNTEPDNVVTYEYDVRNLPVRVVRGNEIVTRIDYDAGGRVVRSIEGYGTAEARLSSASYDGLGHLATTTDAAGLTMAYNTDALGRPTKVEAKDGDTVLAQTDKVYDELGRLTNVNVLHQDENGSSVGVGWLRTTLDYTDAGMLLSEVVEGDTTTYLYDTVMRMEQAASPGGNVRAYAYDDNGNLVTTTEIAFDTESATTTSFITRYGYDELDRMISVGSDDGDGNSNDAKSTRYAYDSRGQMVEEEDALGNVTAYEYDPLGRLESTTRDPDGIEAVVSHGYDPNGRMVLTTDPNGNATSHQYDHFNRLVRTAYADGQVEHYTYDALDNVVEHIAPGGLASRTEFDAAGRPTTQTFSVLAGRANPGESVYTYDALGRVLEGRNAGSTVTRRYDTLGHVATEAIQVGAHAPSVIRRTFDEKGYLKSINPPGAMNTIAYVRNDDGLSTGVMRNTIPLASLGYLGARPNARDLVNGANPVGGTSINFEETGLRPSAIVHTNNASATVDARAFAWDDAYNLDGFQITDGPLADSAVDVDYDALNRIDPDSPSFNPLWTLDLAGNRTGGGYDFTGSDELMHRYTNVASFPQYHDAQGALVKTAVDADTVKEYHYDVNDRLTHYREVTLAGRTAFDPLDIGDWNQVSGSWSVNTGGPDGDYLEETTSAIGAILYSPSPYPENGFTFRYRSTHAPSNPDGNGTPGQFSSSDHPAKYYAQVLLGVDASGGTPYPYAALRIEPDRLSVIAHDDGAIQELDSVQVTTAANTWYTVQLRFVAGGPEGGTLSVERSSGTAGEAVAELMKSVPLPELPEIDSGAIGFTVGSLADYQFQLDEYALAPDTSELFIDWEYDAFGRKVAETVYDSSNAITAQTLYVWDGWRLVSELDGLNGNTVIAEYVPGPAYVDDTVAVRRDLDMPRNGIQSDEVFYYLTDQQYSTVALLDGSGNVVERYGYAPFGAPTIHNADATATLVQSAVGNSRLYTGRDYLPTLGLYDYRQRLYDPAAGRFLTTDPIGRFGDPNNLGNPYTYVGNNPGSFVDPYGEERWGAQSYFADVADVGYGYFVGGPVSIVTGVASAVAHPIETVQGFWSLAGGLAYDPLGTTSGLAGQFYGQFEDSDTAGQATFGATSFAAAPMAATGIAAPSANAIRGAGTMAITVMRPSGVAASVEVAVAKSGAMANASRVTRAGEQLEFDFVPPAAPVASGAFEVGLYRDLVGKLPGYDAHHVGQQIAMKRLIPEYDATTAPAILVPRVGHTKRASVPVLSRSQQGIVNVRQLIARDISELRRVYPEAPNAKLQQLIELNRNLYGRHLEK